MHCAPLLEASKALSDRSLQGVWLFGSEARGEAGATSDIDLAILCDPPLGFERATALAACGVIPAKREQRLRGVAGFRNLLVHDYAVLDVQRVWELIDTRLADLRAIEHCLANIAELRRT